MDREFYVSVCQLLTEILSELRHANNVERTGAVSSVEIKDLASGKPQVTTKVYSGSEPPVEEAIEAHGRARRMAEQQSLNGWQQTLDELKAGCAK